LGIKEYAFNEELFYEQDKGNNKNDCLRVTSGLLLGGLII